jgi:hypothetical protein
MMSEEEISAQCPYCFSPISFVCEFLSGPQSYIEDCEVCCRPIQISYDTSEEGVVGLEVRRLD